MNKKSNKARIFRGTSSQAATISNKEYLKFIIIGSIFGVILAILLFRRLYCFYAYQPEGKAIVIGLTSLATLLGILTQYLNAKRLVIFGRENYLLLGCSILVTMAISIFISPLFYHFDKNSCVDDFEILIDLIEREETAVLTEDMNIIKDIYAPGAIVTRANINESWPAYSYYSFKFKNEELCTISHGHYDVENFAAYEVTISTSSQGTWGTENEGCTQSFNNPPGSDLWTFREIENEWKIVTFEFNLP